MRSMTGIEAFCAIRSYLATAPATASPGSPTPHKPALQQSADHPGHTRDLSSYSRFSVSCNVTPDRRRCPDEASAGWMPSGTPRGGVRGNEKVPVWSGPDGSNPLRLTRLSRRAGHVCAGGRVWLVHPAWPPSGPGPARSTRSDAAEDPARPACRTARTGATPARRSGLFCTGPHPSALHQSLSPRPLKAFSRCRRPFSERSHAGSGRTATGRRTARRATGSGPGR